MGQRPMESNHGSLLVINSHFRFWLLVPASPPLSQTVLMYTTLSVALSPVSMMGAGPEPPPRGPTLPPCPALQRTVANNHWTTIKNIRAEIYIWALGRKHSPLTIHLVALRTNHPPSLAIIGSVCIITYIFCLIITCSQLFSHIYLIAFIDRTLSSITECLVKYSKHIFIFIFLLVVIVKLYAGKLSLICVITNVSFKTMLIWNINFMCRK